MSGPGRISLRARPLIAVTATFLLIMGGVTMLVLSRRLGQQFNADLAACAANKPQKLYGLPGGCTRVRVWLPAGTIAASPAPGQGRPGSARVTEPAGVSSPPGRARPQRRNTV